MDADRRHDRPLAAERLLPETRLRVMQVFQGGDHSTSYLDEAGTVVQTSGLTTTVEARLTWRFDRLLFAEDETRLERVRMERQDTRSRIAARVLELLFTWQRALLDAQASDDGSRAELEATLRQYEAEVSLDVLTARRWFAQPSAQHAWPSTASPKDPAKRSQGSRERGPLTGLTLEAAELKVSQDPMLTESRITLDDLQKRLTTLRGHL